MNRNDGSIEQPSGSVQIVNVCSKNKNRRLEGAVFTLYKYNQNTCSFAIANTNLVTSPNGILFIDNLLPGQYKLVETKAPKGYYLCKNIAAYFHICLDDKGQIIELEPIYIYNLPLGSIKIIKSDSMKHTLRLEGAVFDLYVYEQKKKKFALVQTNLSTDKHGSLIISNLEPGHYKLLEIKAPPGYELPSNTETIFVISIEDKGIV